MPRVLLPLAIPDLVPLRPGASVTGLHGQTMGTSWCVKAVLPVSLSAERGRAAIERRLHDIVAQMSTWLSDSDISRFNRAAPGTWFDVRPEFSQVLRCALDVAALSNGAFDPTLGALVEAWGFGPSGPRRRIPDERTIASAAARSAWQRLKLDGETRVLQPGGVVLDLSSIAKGYAVDRVADELNQLGAIDHLVEIGGELRGSGIKPDGSPWWVALENPPSVIPMQDDVETRVALHGLAVATSGDLQRYFEQGGRRYSHTLDPRTGYPVDERLVLVSVLHPACMMADALATAFTVLGPENGNELAIRMNVAARFVLRSADGWNERITPRFAAMLA